MTVAFQATTTGPGLSLPSAGVRPDVSEREGLDLSRASAGSSFILHPSSFDAVSPSSDVDRAWVRHKVISRSATCSYTEPVIQRAAAGSGGNCRRRSQGESKMTPVQEHQMLTSLTVISENMKMLVALMKELRLQQETADEKAYTQLVNIAHKR